LLEQLLPPVLDFGFGGFHFLFQIRSPHGAGAWEETK
jgi:hypothetical protein